MIVSAVDASHRDASTPAVHLIARVGAPLRQARQKKEPPEAVRPILFCKQTLYGERNSEIVRAVRTRGVLRSREPVFHRSAATAADAQRNCHDLRARCGKSRAECRHSVYDTDGLAGTDGVFVFR